MAMPDYSKVREGVRTLELTSPARSRGDDLSVLSNTPSPRPLLEAMRTHSHPLRQFADHKILRSIVQLSGELTRKSSLDLLDAAWAKSPNSRGLEVAAVKLAEQLRDLSDRSTAWSNGGKIDLACIPAPVRVFLRWTAIHDESREKPRALGQATDFNTDRVFSEDKRLDRVLVSEALRAFRDPASKFYFKDNSGVPGPASAEIHERFTTYVRRHASTEKFLIDPPTSVPKFVLEAFEGASRLATGECRLVFEELNKPISRAPSEGAHINNFAVLAQSLEEVAKSDPLNRVMVQRSTSSLRVLLSAEKIEGREAELLENALRALRIRLGAIVIKNPGSDNVRELLIGTLETIGELGAANNLVGMNSRAEIRELIAPPNRISISLGAARAAASLKDPEAVNLLCSRLKGKEGVQVKHGDKVVLAESAISIALALRSKDHLAAVCAAIRKYDDNLAAGSECDKARIFDQRTDLCKLRIRLALGASYSGEFEKAIAKISNFALRNRVQFAVFEPLADAIERAGEHFELQNLEPLARSIAETKIQPGVELRW